MFLFRTKIPHLKCILTTSSVKVKAYPCSQLHTGLLHRTFVLRHPVSASRLHTAVLRHTARCPHLYACGAAARFNSTQAGAEITDGYIPDKPPLPEVDLGSVDTVVEPVLNALGEPTLASLGIAHWTPPGFVQMAVEQLHVTVDLPWWSAIVAGTLIIRLCIFPLVIYSQRNAANLANHMPIVQKLQDRFTKARLGGNSIEAARAYSELSEYMKRYKVNPLKNFAVPLAQMPIFISVFVGLRGMANLPVQSMTTGGIFWFTDLTIPDPTYLLPLMTVSTFLATIELGVDGVKAKTMTHTMKWVMRLMPVFMFPFIINFPTGMLCYWFTSNLFSLCQVLFLKIPSMRVFFKIPDIVDHAAADPHTQTKTPKKGFVQGFKETWSNSKMVAQLEERHKLDSRRFEEAGKAPITKTYKYDPTKVDPKKLSAKKS